MCAHIGVFADKCQKFNRSFRFNSVLLSSGLKNYVKYKVSLLFHLQDFTVSKVKIFQSESILCLQTPP
jgi:hypothetical protein